jgi:fumarylacetoacetase
MSTELRSFVDVAATSHFPIQNLPYGIFSPRDGGVPRVGTRIGDYVLDLAALEVAAFFEDAPFHGQAVFAGPTLNPFMALGRAGWQAARRIITGLLRADNPLLRDNERLRRRVLLPINDVILHLPASIGDYTDFYSSREHASNVGSMFRTPAAPLLPNWRHLPVAYHGRASSIVVSGTPIHRPFGQVKAAGDAAPTFQASAELDFELEVGYFVGPGNPLGQPVPVTRAEEHIFGMVLVNDWSARDIQRWEYRPLGPFLAKNFATSISPWVVTLEALAPFRVAAPVQDPSPLPYLQHAGHCSYDVHLQVLLQTDVMAVPALIADTNFRHLYWTPCQQLAHHTSSGCNLRSGDLLASGTISGPTADSYGSMLELAWRGEKPVQLPGGEQRSFLHDGDTVTLTGWCQGDGYRVGFGEVTGRIVAAR